MTGLEFLSLALYKHYQREICYELDAWDSTEPRRGYQQCGGEVLDKNIYMVLNIHGEGGPCSKYGRELLDMWKGGVFEENEEVAVESSVT